jgi:hypothetical protein
MENWQKVAEIAMKNKINVKTPSGEVQIKLLLGTDAVHGN